jgi:signal transduction histidine kinase
MKEPLPSPKSVIRTGSSLNLAFALVLLTSYFFTFSAIKSLSTTQIAVLIGIGMAYLSVGIYGYGYCARSTGMVIKFLYFAIQLVMGGVIIYLTREAGLNLLILLPLAGQSIVLLPSIPAYMVNLLIIVTYGIANASFKAGLGSAWSILATFITGQIFVVVFTQTAVGEEKARIEVERLVKELEAANQQLRTFAVQVEDLAVTKERNRLAREIHDGLGHYLTTIFMQIQAARAVMGKDMSKTNAALVTAQQLTQEALSDVRQSVAALRTGFSDAEPLIDRLAKLVKSCESAEMSGNFEVIGAARELSPQLQLAIYRAVQEGINNTCKHAQASHVWVQLDFSDILQVTLLVKDNGIGTESLEGGFGLIGLQERVHLLHGTVEFSTQTGSGFSIKVVIPDETID